MTEDDARQKLVAAMRGEAEPPAGARQLVKLDLPPNADLTAAPLWLVGNPLDGRMITAPLEITGSGLRLWHERARRLGLMPGSAVWVMPLGGATGEAGMDPSVCTRVDRP